jgi:hypothetical protein
MSGGLHRIRDQEVGWDECLPLPHWHSGKEFGG